MDKTFDATYSESFYDYHISAAKSLDALVSLIVDIVNPGSVVDIGCSVGAALSCFKTKGVNEILGVDGFWVKDEQLLIARNEFIRHDFSKEGFLSLPKKYDLAISTEVAEHIDEDNADDFITTLVSASDVVIFSAAIPGQGGVNHVNEQYQQYWIDKFSEHDYIVYDCLRGSLWNIEDVSFWYKQNLLLFCKNNRESILNLPDTVTPVYNIIHPQQYEQKLFQLYGMFKQLYDNENYDVILQLSFLSNFDSSAKFFLGLVYFHRNEYRQCIEYLEKFIELSGVGSFAMFTSAYYALGSSFYHTEEYRKAKLNLEKSIQAGDEYKELSMTLLSQIEPDNESATTPSSIHPSNLQTQTLIDFLSETDPYIEQLDTLSFDTVAELYDLLDEAACAATTQISEIDPELRVKICDRQDLVLDRIVDVLPPFKHCDSQIKIYSPALWHYRDWQNVQLMKDCGLAGYLLAKEINGKSIMFFATAGEDYPYLSILPGLELIYRESADDTAADHFSHLENNFVDMDVLLLYGIHKQSIDYLEAYRLLHPDGKV